VTSPLDDALNSAAPLFSPPSLIVDWLEVPDSEGTRIENLRDMSDMLEGSFKVDQSFDDALPDPVTMTTSSDASGVLEATLTGREGQVLNTVSVVGTRTNTSAVFSNTAQVMLPAGVQEGDYIICAVIIDDGDVEVFGDRDYHPGEKFDKLIQFSQGNKQLVVFGHDYYSSLGSNVFLRWDSDLNLQNECAAVTVLRATAPNDAKLVWKVRQTTGGVVGGSTSSHSVGTVTVPKGYAVGFLGSTGSLTYTNTGSGSITQQSQTATNSLAMFLAGFTASPTNYTFSATSSGATATAMYAVVAIEPYERPRMTPTQFWSPFMADSPVHGFDRDTAGVQFVHNTVTTNGVEGVTLYQGLMNDVQLRSGQTVEMSGVSRTRINLNRSLELPMVFGRREGLTIDWVVTWLLSRGDRFFGPSPSVNSSYWVPMYGSVHAAQDADKGYNYVVTFTSEGNNIGKRYPEVIEGPFHTAMFACQQTDLVQQINIDAIDLYKSKEVVPPAFAEPSRDLSTLQNQLSPGSHAGRLSFWIKGDPWATAGLPGSAQAFPFNFIIEGKLADDTTFAKVQMWINPSGALSTQMGSDAVGFGTVVWGSSFTLPQDGDWHFYSIFWDLFGGQMSVMMDGVKSTSTYWDTSNYNVTDYPYPSDAAVYAAGGIIDNQGWFQLPVSDFLIEAGYDFEYFDDQWPVASWPSFTAFARPTYTPLEAIGGTGPVNGWDTLADLARNTMSMYRANEEDGYEFFPPRYFGETAQLTPSTIADTEVNAQDLSVTIDPSKSRNVVTVLFDETRVDESYTSCLILTSAVEIPRGKSEILFTLDNEVAEIHGASQPYFPWWTLTNANASQVASGTWPTGGFPVNVHFMTVNTKSDGSGSVIPSASVSARIVSFTSSTVTLEFTNKLSTTAWLSNNYEGDIPLPFLRILGYNIRRSDGYVTERDQGSITTRRERSLDVEMNWIQSRTSAQELASLLVTTLARPRRELEVIVQGDPRRVPGNLVTVQDAQGTQADGTWRILSITHDGDGAKYLQVLRMVYVPPAGFWDTLPGWDDSVWGE